MVQIDFTLARYIELLKALQEAKYGFHTFDDLFLNKAEGRSIILRHDVDRFPKNALAMAEEERLIGIKSIYFFRSKKCSFNSKIIRRIKELGHQIGYHYEELADTKGDVKSAWISFQKNVENLRNLSEIKYICMHGRPLSRWNGQTLWKHFDFKSINLKDVVIDLNWKNLYYFTDTGRSWNSSENFRDVVSNPIKLKQVVSRTDELQSYLLSKGSSIAVISTHPERWGYDKASLARSYTLDLCANAIKKLIRVVR